MKKSIPAFLTVLLLTSCSSVMMTGRKQLNLVSDAELNQMSFAAYEQLKDSVPISSDKTNAAMVKRVGTNIAAAVEKYMRANGLEANIQNFQWEYNLFRVNQVNAFAMPGGKIAVYEGILPKTLNEAGMAVVVGHEIGHVIARHSAERYSQQVAAQYGGAILGAVVGGSSAVVQNGVGLLYGIGGQMMMLKYSRNQEYEADELGVIFMAMAGYDPNDALNFWTRMTADNTQSTSDFMSTHPSDDKRIARMKEVAIPKALQYYKK
ncbi:MAG: M48 family metallopeptidase [Paludibacteraceae bacterium]